MSDTGACREVGGTDGESLCIVAWDVVDSQVYHVGGDFVVVFDGYPKSYIGTFGVETYL